VKRILSLSTLAALAASVLFVGCQPKSDIKIGAILPLTGDAAKWGQASKNAIDLAVEGINKSGGISGRKVAVLFEDDRGGVTDATNAMTKLVKVDKVPLVLGTLFSSATLAIAPIANENKVVLLSPASSAPKITQAGDFIFRNCASDVYEGGIMAGFVHDTLKYRKVGVAYINNDYGLGLKTEFETAFKAKGGEIVASEAFDQGATDFRSLLLKIKAAAPDAIYLPGYPPEMGRLLRQAKELGINKQFLSVVIFEDPRVLELAGGAAEGVIYSCQIFDPTSGEANVRKFVTAYKTKYGSDPDIYAGLSYDAMNIAALAIKNGGTTGGGIRDALYKIRDFPGVTGVTTFDQNGDVTKPIGLKMVRNGKFEWYTHR